MTPKEKANELMIKISECEENGKMYIEKVKRILNIFIDNIIQNATPKQKTYWKLVRNEINIKSVL